MKMKSTNAVFPGEYVSAPLEKDRVIQKYVMTQAGRYNSSYFSFTLTSLTRERDPTYN